MDKDLITLKEYAILHGILPDSARQKANRNGYNTAVKIGRDWFIDKNEPFKDNRFKKGKDTHSKTKEEEED